MIIRYAVIQNSRYTKPNKLEGHYAVVVHKGRIRFASRLDHRLYGLKFSVFFWTNSRIIFRLGHSAYFHTLFSLSLINHHTTRLYRINWWQHHEINTREMMSWCLIIVLLLIFAHMTWFRISRYATLIVFGFSRRGTRGGVVEALCTRRKVAGFFFPHEVILFFG
jgi:hypothetical protein